MISQYTEEVEMKQVNIFSILDLLNNKAYSHNVSSISKLLNVSRGKIYKYLNDTEMDKHCVMVHKGKLVLRTTK